MTKRTAYLISAIAIICGLSYSVYDMHAMANDSTSQILRANGINPWDGQRMEAIRAEAWLKSRPMRSTMEAAR